MVLDIVAIVTPAKGKEARMEELLEGLGKQVRENEHKVIRYKPYKTTHEDGTVEFVVIERYPDEQELGAHMGTDFFQSLGKTIQEEGLLAKGLNIMKLTPLKEGFQDR